MECSGSTPSTSTDPRFIYENPDDLIMSKYSKKTEYSTKYAIGLFTKFLSRNSLKLETLSNSEMASQLCDFYASLRNNSGEDMTSATIKNIRYGITRHLKASRDVDIMKHPDFQHSNDVYMGKMAKLKRQGSGVTKHFEVITKEDLLKISEMKTDSPVNLQLKVWFTIQYHFAQRGAENTHSMLKSDLHIITNANGKMEVHLRDFMTKNHRVLDASKSTSAFIVEVGSEHCPVGLINRYLSLLPIENPYLWQKPNTSNYVSSGKWYYNSKVGENQIKSMMKRICVACNINTPYTNHCVRATSITVLGAQFGDNDICSVSGHKSLNALGIYKRTSPAILEAMSDHLHQSLHPSTSNNMGASQCGTVDIDNPCDQTSHKLCCISHGIHSENVTLNKPLTIEHNLPVINPLDSDMNDGVPLSDNEWENLMTACQQVENNVVNTVQQQAIKKGNKVIILNNCQGTFHF